MEENTHAGFLLPFSLSLRAASGDEQALRGVAPEVRKVAERVVEVIKSFDDVG